MGSLRHPDLKPTHPGEVLREDVFPALGMSMTAIAKALGISRQMLLRLVNEKQPVTPETAVRLGKFLGNGPALWFNMQAAYDLWHAERNVDTSAIPTVSQDAA